MKRCDEYQQLLLEHLYELLEADQQRELEEHLIECAPCRAALERARQEQAWLRRAALWSFEEVRFEPPEPAEIARPTSAQPGKIGVATWGAFFVENLSLWTLAASLLLAIGLGVWWAVFLGEASPDLARRDGAPVQWAGDLTEQDAALGRAPSRDQGQGLPRSTFGPSPDLAAPNQSSTSLPGSQLSALAEPKVRGQTLTTEACPDLAVSKPGIAGLRSEASAAPAALQAARGAPTIPVGEDSGRLGSAQVGQAPLAEGGRGGSFGKQEERSAEAAWAELEGFTAFRVSQVPTADKLFARLEIITLLNGDVRASSVETLAAQKDSPKEEKKAVFLIVPVENPASSPEASQVPQLAGVHQASEPKTKVANNLQLLQAPSDNSSAQPQVGNVLRQQLPQTWFNQEFVAPLPPTAALRRGGQAAPSVEVPVEWGNLARLVSAVRLPLQPFGFVPAIRLVEDEVAKCYQVQIMPLDFNSLKPVMIRATVAGQLVDENGQVVGKKVRARLQAASRPQKPNNAEFQFYEIRLPWPSKAVPSWLQITDETGQMPTISLRLRPMGKRESRHSQPKDCGETSLTHSSATSMSWFPGAETEGGTLTVQLVSRSEMAELQINWREAICCSDKELALELGLLARDSDRLGVLERSFSKQIRDYLRREAGERATHHEPRMATPGLDLRHDVHSVRLAESHRVAEFFSRLLPSPESYEAVWTVVCFGLFVGLGWLAFACGIFGAVNGRASYLCWSRRIISLMLALAMLWWAWTSAEAQLPGQKSPARTLQPPASPGSTLAEVPR